MPHTLIFSSEEKPQVTVQAPTGMLISEAAQLAGLEIHQPCGGQGRCGRCIVQVLEGQVRRRSTLRLSAEDLAQGYALACQSVIEGAARVRIPPQETIERRLTTDRAAAEVYIPADYDPHLHQTLRRYCLRLSPPRLDDQTDDWNRLQTALRTQAGIERLTCSLSTLRTLGDRLREGDWQVTLILDQTPGETARLIEVLPGFVEEKAPLWGIAVDIGTTTVTLWLVDLLSGEVHAQVAEYNAQIARGEDVISRIIYASKNSGGEEMRQRVLQTINKLLEQACKRARIRPEQVMKATIVGNTTMIHLFLGIPAASIRLSPFVPVVNQPPPLSGLESGLAIHPQARVECLPCVASYVGADITAGALSSGLADSEEVCLFIDIGTNGEIVLGNREWMVTCACSAGPAFEGAGVLHGMRATSGAIEEVWINSQTYEPTYRVIGGGRPQGLCGSGLICLLSEMFLTGLLDKAGNINLSLPTPRVRQGEHGAEYVVAWGHETAHGQDIVITRVDIDNLLRAKAAIYAGFTVLAEQVGVPLESVSKVLIGGAFGKYINVEKAVQIGLLPDMPWDRFEFLGNTAVRGAYLALLDRRAQERVEEIARRMTYIELSADNTFYEAFTSALFLPHTDLGRFPSVVAALSKPTP
ncbi:MAG: ASKHA domain-containing protein [Anaerolineales bacterium]